MLTPHSYWCFNYPTIVIMNGPIVTGTIWTLLFCFVIWLMYRNKHYVEKHTCKMKAGDLIGAYRWELLYMKIHLTIQCGICTSWRVDQVTVLWNIFWWGQFYHILVKHMSMPNNYLIILLSLYNFVISIFLTDILC